MAARQYTETAYYDFDKNYASLTPWPDMLFGTYQ